MNGARNAGDRPTSWRACVVAGLAHGLLFTLAFPPYNLWPLAWIAIAPVTMLALRTRSRGRAVLSVWLTSALFWLWINRWLIDVTWQGYPLLALYQGAYPAAFVWILSRLRPRDGAPLVPALTNTLLVPITWVGLEMLRGAGMGEGAYPWFFLGHPLIHAPILCQTADLFGTYAVSFLAAMPAGLMADFLTLPMLRERKLAPTLKVALAIFLALQAGTIVYGLVRYYNTDEAVAEQPGLTVAAVQTNIPQSNKLGWELEDQIRDFARFVGLTREAKRRADTIAGRPLDLILWPETMTPGYFGLNDEAQAALDEYEREVGRPYPIRPREPLARLATELETPILVGAHAEPQLEIHAGQDDPVVSPVRYNSAYLFVPARGLAPERYDKLGLTPFGEMIPYLNRWPAIEQWLLNLGAHGLSFDLSPGEGVVRIEVPLVNASNVYTLGTPICFESTMAGLCRRLVWDDAEGKSADALINLTNDGWFGRHRGGRDQHLMIGRFRCIENRVPMVRAANTGISAAIDSAGRLIQYGPNDPSDADVWDSEGLMIATIHADPRRTLYGRIGDAFGWMLLAMTAVLLIGSWLRGRLDETRDKK